jgi:hypothetical protein
MLVLMMFAYCAPTADAVDTEGDKNDDSEASFNFVGWFFLLLALFGWSIFLALLGTAIYMVARKSKGAYVVKNPVRCK